MHEPASPFAVLAQTWSRRLYLVALRYASNADDARELVQEALLRAWRGHCERPDQSLSAGWLFVILRNVATDWHRAGTRRLRTVPMHIGELTDPVGDSGADFAPFPPIDEASFRQLLDERLLAALDALEPPFREVIVLSVVGGLKASELSLVLECPLGTVLSRMSRARRMLREQLATYAREMGWDRSTAQKGGRHEV